jgi:hypothetical protein
LANGAAADTATPEIDEAKDKQAYEVFKKELTEFAIDLAKLVVRDGEGATKFVTITVKVRDPLYHCSCGWANQLDLFRALRHIKMHTSLLLVYLRLHLSRQLFTVKMPSTSTIFLPPFPILWF